MAPLLSRTGKIFPIVWTDGAKGISKVPLLKALITPRAISFSPISKHLSTIHLVSFFIISFSNSTSLLLNSWSFNIYKTCFVQRRPCAFASLVGTPIASWGVFTITFVAFESDANTLPKAITPKALASSWGKLPIHWCKTVVIITSSYPFFIKYSLVNSSKDFIAAISWTIFPHWPYPTDMFFTPCSAANKVSIIATAWDIQGGTKVPVRGP